MCSRSPPIAYNSEMAGNFRYLHTSPGYLNTAFQACSFCARFPIRKQGSAQESGIHPRANLSARELMHGEPVGTLYHLPRSYKTVPHAHYLTLCLHTYPEILTQSVLNLSFKKYAFMWRRPAGVQMQDGGDQWGRVVRGAS